MIRLEPQAFSGLYGKNLIAYGTGNMAKRYVPYLVQDPDIRLCGITNSRIEAEDEGTFLDTGLPIRSIRKWAELFPGATILLTGFVDAEEIVSNCKGMGFNSFQFITPEMVSALADMEADIAQAQQSKILEHLCLSNELHDAHKTAFSEFKGCNKGKSVVIVGTGPSLSYYSQLPEVPHIGVNSSYLKENLILDYYFIAHNESQWLERLKEYNFTKFFKVGIINRKSKDQIPEYIIEENNGRRYFSMPLIPFTQIHTNIEYYPVMGHESVIFQAIHFALYTRPKKLFLVGCDCAATGHYDKSAYPESVGQLHIPLWISGYKEVKKFASIHYPDTEIISINPVGLTGMFSDIYTKNYIDMHPEINGSECRILDAADFE